MFSLSAFSLSICSETLSSFSEGITASDCPSFSFSEMSSPTSSWIPSSFALSSLLVLSLLPEVSSGSAVEKVGGDSYSSSNEYSIS